MDVIPRNLPAVLARMFICFVLHGAAAPVFAAEDLSVNIKQMLKRDFGYDVEIAGGRGTRDQPIVVTAVSSRDAEQTIMLTLRGLGKGRGILWRLIDRQAVTHNGRALEQAKIETKELTEENIVSQTESYYFLLTDSEREPGSAYPLVVYEDSESGLALPYEMGWVHYDGLTDNEPENPGLGTTIAYGAPGIKATVYVYNKGLADIPADIGGELVRREFEEATQDFLTLHPNSESLGAAARTPGMIYQGYTVGSNVSVIALMVKGRKFVKMRLTFVQDPVLYELSNDTLSAYHAIVTAQ